MKRSDLANFDPDTPLEKLRCAREEMQRNFQQPMSARTMRVCTVCSERWDTASDGGGDYRWMMCCKKTAASAASMYTAVYMCDVITCHGSTAQQQQSAFNLEAGPAIGNEALAGTRRFIFIFNVALYCTYVPGIILSY